MPSICNSGASIQFRVSQEYASILYFCTCLLLSTNYSKDDQEVYTQTAGEHKLPQKLNVDNFIPCVYVYSLIQQ